MSDSTTASRASTSASVQPVSNEDLWKILESYFDKYGFADHQIQSYDRFVHHSLPRIISDEPDVIINTFEKIISIKFSNVYVAPPSVVDVDRTIKKLIPSDCRQRDITYASTIYVDVDSVIDKPDSEPIINKYTRVDIGRIPVMLKSSLCHLSNMTPSEIKDVKECEHDQGGYFVINGGERVLVGQCRDAYNTVLVFPQTNKKWLKVAEIRSMSEETGHSVLVKAIIDSDDRGIYFSLPYVKLIIQAGVVFKAYGFLKDDIVAMIGLNMSCVKKYIRYILWDYDIYDTPEEALVFIGNNTLHNVKETERVKYAKQIIEAELFPHMGITCTTKECGYMLGHMINKILMTHVGLREYDNRDNYMNKRVETSGILMTELFKQLFKKYIESVTKQIIKKKQDPDILTVLSRSTVITNGLSRCFSTGDWGVQLGSYMKVGVSQVLSRLSYGATLSHLRRFSLSVGKEIKTSKLRQIDPSSIMYVCPHETPEGEPVGIVLNLSMLVRVSEYTCTTLVKHILDTCDHLTLLRNFEVDAADFSSVMDVTRVFINGIIYGMTKDPHELVDEIETYRAHDMLAYDVSVSYNDVDNEVHVWSDEGRLTRPVLRVEDDHLTLAKDRITNWDDLVKAGHVKFIDSYEANYAVIAFGQEELVKYKNDYCEISPSMMLSVMASIVPFPDHSPSPRICYIAAMGKQAMSMFSLAHEHRTDTIANVLRYPQKPLVFTKQANMMGFNEMPTGMNAMVAIMCHGGCNQEDSILIKKEAVERGMFVADTYRTYTDSEKKEESNTQYVIGNPPIADRLKDVNYGYLDNRGVIIQRLPNGGQTYARVGDVIIGKYVVINRKNDEPQIKDCSVVIRKKEEEGYVHRVFVSKQPNGHTIVKVKIRTQRVPEIGDKFVSRAAQKGTVGGIVDTIDMPFTADGIVPDIFLNPHCIPSRMTLNQLMECVLGKSCSLSGTTGDSTVFTEWSGNTEAEICKVLRANGFESHGFEQMYSGLTGEPIKAKIFCGPTYYQRLKHLVSEKYHARARGPINTMFRQPMSGRAKGGGHRCGEMEVQALAAHGASWFLHERMCKYSDPFQVSVCNDCHNFSNTDESCKACNSGNISIVNTSYTSKLLLQELNALCFKTDITT